MRWWLTVVRSLMYTVQRKIWNEIYSLVPFLYILNRILYVKIKILLKNIEKALTTGKKGKDEKVSLIFV